MTGSLPCGTMGEMKGNEMSKTVEQRLAELDAAILAGIWVPNNLIPERYHDNREGGSTLERVMRIYNKEVSPVINADPREKSVVISNGVIQHGSQERIDILNKYRDDIDAGREIEYDVNEDKLYRNQQAMASAIGLEWENEE